MKKIVFLLLLCVACCMNAQEFHLIPKVGLNLANTTGEVDSESASRTQYRSGR